MGAKSEQHESETRTLGDLLYGNNTKVRVSEQDWAGLVASIATGDQVALHSLYEQTHRIVFTLIARIVNNRESAEELTVDVFYDVWRKASSYDPANGSVVGWIMNQARSRAIDRFRCEHRRKRLNTDGGTTLITTASNDPHQACQLKEQGRLVRAALELLTPEERRAIVTAFFSELTYEEVATRLQQPIGTVKTRIRSGLGKLRQALAAIAGSP
jgi:RNA polymerase sigma-70 factor (ECF subfamily)